MSDSAKGGAARNSEAALTIIAAGTRFEGEVRSNGVVKIEGEVVGTVRAARQVLIARGGRVEGDVVTQEAVVGGMVQGSVVADDRVEVQAGSVVSGDIGTQRLIVQEGGEVNGQVKMGKPGEIKTNARRERQGIPARIPS
jgi:cytoskeletal protein CcmA (bactofilin family)